PLSGGLSPTGRVRGDGCGGLPGGDGGCGDPGAGRALEGARRLLPVPPASGGGPGIGGGLRRTAPSDHAGTVGISGSAGNDDETAVRRDRKSTRLNSSHVKISYA